MFYVFSLFVFKVDFVLKIKYNLCLVALFWLETKHKTRHCQGENSSIFVLKMYKEKCIKIVNLQTRKNELTGWKVLKQPFNFSNFWVCAAFPYNQN